MMEAFDLSGCTALITGGSKGIGLEMAVFLAEAGADVAVASRHLEEGKAAVEEIERRGRRGLAIGGRRLSAARLRNDCEGDSGFTSAGWTS